MADPRGNLMLTYLAMADHFKPKWLLWENVPGVLSSNGGSDFAALLQGLAQLGYGFAYRVLDAQYFGVPQRRRRVFVVGCFGDWRSAAKVLFESESLCRNITPSRGEGQKATGTLTRGFGDRGYDLDQIAGGGYKIEQYADVAQCLTTKKRDDAESETFAIQSTIIGRKPENGPQGSGISEDLSFTLTKTDQHAVAFKMRGGCEGGGKGYLGSDELAFTLSTHQDQQIAVSHPIVLEDQGGSVINTRQDGTVGTLRAQTHGHEPAIISNMAVRRLTPMECERLQGFPDNYTNTPTASDTTRYRALGNSMAVPCMSWLGKRIKEVENA